MNCKFNDFLYICITTTNIKYLIFIYQSEKSSFSVVAERGFFI